MNHQVYVHRHRVHYAECTLGNHIYYARYLDLLETARGEMFRQLGQPFLHWQEQGFLFPVLEVHLRYRHPARYDDELDLALWLTRLDRVRLNFGCSIRNQRGELVLDGETWHVCTSLEEKPRRLPPELAASLRSYLQANATPHQVRSMGLAGPEEIPGPT
jgi:acyl-CoA thioester hydrolase